MKRSPFLLLRDGRPYFRIRIPADLQHAYQGRSEVKFALKITDPAKARTEALRLGAEHRITFEKMREAIRNPRPSPDLEAVLRMIQSAILAADEEARAEGLPRHPAEDVAAERKVLGRAIATGDLTSTRVLEILADWGIEEPDRRQQYETAKTLAKALDARIARDRGEIVDTPPMPKLNGPDGRTLRWVHAQWVDRRKPAPKTQHEALRELNGFLGEGRDKAIGKITRKDIVDYKDRVLADGTKATTAKKRLSFIRTFLTFAVAEGWLDADPSAGIRIVTPKKSGKEERRPFTKDEIKAILATPMGTKPEERFLPILAAFTGARRGELAQLRRTDIDTEALTLTVTDEDEDQRVKTAGSRRTLPIHPEIVKAGFIDYVKGLPESEGASRGARPEGWVFPGLPADRFGIRGDAWGKAFGRHLRNTLKITDRRAVFHSFRHTLKRALRDLGCPKEIHDAITGHEGEDVGSSYGRGVSVETMREWLGKVERAKLGVD